MSAGALRVTERMANVSEPQNISQTRRFLYAGAAGGVMLLLGEGPSMAVFAGVGVYCFTAIEGWFADLNRSVRNRGSATLDLN